MNTLFKRCRGSRCIGKSASHLFVGPTGSCNRSIAHPFGAGSRWCVSTPLQDLGHSIGDIELLRAHVEASAIERHLMHQQAENAIVEGAEIRKHLSELTNDIHDLIVMLRREGVGYRSPRPRLATCGSDARDVLRPENDFVVLQPSHLSEMGHQVIAKLALVSNHASHRERLLREIMAVEACAWDQAHEVLAVMDQYNEQYYWIISLPYRLGISAAFVFGIAGCLLVFYKPAALWYAHNIVQEDLPEGVDDINTMTTNQVGTWTWNWMEPMIGTASFFLICCQFTRAQIRNLDIKPFTQRMVARRADRCAQRFPMYDKSVVRAWAKHMPVVGADFLPVYKRDQGFKGPTSGL